MTSEFPQIDKNLSLPRHIQVQRNLRSLIDQGVLIPGEKIPSEVEIARQMGVSKMTVNKALLALTADGFFVREVGRGTFVASRGDIADGALHFRKGSTEDAPVERQRVVLSFVEGAQKVLESDYYSGIYTGVAEILDAEESNADLTLSALKSRDYMEANRREPAAGWLIVAPREEAVPSIQTLWNSGTPLVVIGASWAVLQVPVVDSDNFTGGQDAVRFLVSEGHRRIALFFAEEETANVRDRRAGFRAGLQEAGIACDPAWEVRAEEVWRSGEAATEQLRELITGENPVTAIFAVGHFLALEAMRVVRQCGLDVPESVSVIGYDDPMSARLAYPSLTTVRQPLAEMGRQAALWLLEMLKDTERRTVRRDVLSTELTVRESVMPPETGELNTAVSSLSPVSDVKSRFSHSQTHQVRI
ncbi:MAG: LacI family DNA-binding transcriptional regulator [Armatimonadaceae bacterium]